MAQVFNTSNAILRNQFAFCLPNAFMRLGIGKTSARDVAAKNAVRVIKTAVCDARIASVFCMVFCFIAEFFHLLKYPFSVPPLFNQCPHYQVIDPVLLDSHAIQSTLTARRYCYSGITQHLYECDMGLSNV
ncbi:MAG: hypothetical protein GXP08_04795 [Gammaproteobacteria bacterium]|nr:hypothetical protein [Gammaproteobacteria bacterium]